MEIHSYSRNGKILGKLRVETKQKIFENRMKGYAVRRKEETDWINKLRLKRRLEKAKNKFLAFRDSPFVQHIRSLSDSTSAYASDFSMKTEKLSDDKLLRNSWCANKYSDKSQVVQESESEKNSPSSYGNYSEKPYKHPGISYKKPSFHTEFRGSERLYLRNFSVFNEKYNHQHPKDVLRMLTSEEPSLIHSNDESKNPEGLISIGNSEKSSPNSSMRYCKQPPITRSSMKQFEYKSNRSSDTISEIHQLLRQSSKSCLDLQYQNSLSSSQNSSKMASRMSRQIEEIEQEEKELLDSIKSIDQDLRVKLRRNSAHESLQNFKQSETII